MRNSRIQLKREIKEGKESGDIFSDADDKEDDGFDLKNWSPLREVYDSMPTFSVGV